MLPRFVSFGPGCNGDTTARVVEKAEDDELSHADSAVILSILQRVCASQQRLEDKLDFVVGKLCADGRSPERNSQRRSPLEDELQANNAEFSRLVSSKVGGGLVVKSATGNSASSIPADLKRTGSKETNLGFAFMLPTNWPAGVRLRKNFESVICEESTDVRSQQKRLLKGRTNQRQTSSGFAKFIEYEVGDKRRRWMMDPGSRFLMFWGILSMGVLVYDLTVIPYILAWDVSYETGLLNTLSWCTVAFWTIDIMMTFRIGYYNRAELVVEPKRVAMHYISTWFIPDMSIAMCDWLGMIIVEFVGRHTEGDQNDVTGGSFKLLRFAKLGRLLRIAAVLRMLRFVSLIEVKVEKAMMAEKYRLTIRILTIVFHIMWFNHFMCCAWYAIGIRAPSDTGYHWVDLTNFSEDQEFYEYFTSLHWTVAQFTLGAIEINCVNSAERAFNIGFLILGLLFGSTLVSSLSAAMIEFQMAKAEQVKKVKQVAQYLEENSVDRRISQLVNEQVNERLWKKEMLLYNDVEAFALLSTSVRKELLFEVFKGHLDQHPLFRLWTRVDPNVTREVCLCAAEYKFIMRMDELFMPGVVAKGAYYLVHGGLVYKQSPQSAPVSEESETPVSTSTWISEAALWSEWMHVGTAEASTKCQLLVINGDNLGNAVKKGYIARQVTVEYCRQYYRRIISAKPPTSRWPNDLHVPFTDYASLVWSMDKEVQEVIGMDAIEQANSGGRFLKKGFGRKFEALEQEVQKGKSTVMVNGKGEVERVVSVLALRIEDQNDRIFVQLAKYEDGQINAAVQLPGMKQERGELPEETVKRLVETKLEPLDGNTEVVRMESEVEVKQSTEYGVRTKYLRTVCIARLSGRFDCEPCLHKQAAVSAGTRAIRGQLRLNPNLSSSGEGPECGALENSPRGRFDRRHTSGFGISDATIEGHQTTGKLLSAATRDLGAGAREDRDKAICAELALINVYAIGDLEKVGFFGWVNQAEFKRLKEIPNNTLVSWLNQYNLRNVSSTSPQVSAARTLSARSEVVATLD